MSENTESVVEKSVERAAVEAPETGKPESAAPLLVTSDGTAYEIPEEGSLGLLAMGYTGIMLWRDRRYRPAK